MRRQLVIASAIVTFGCGNDPKADIIGQMDSPSKEFTMSAVREEGGLGSDVVKVFVSARGSLPTNRDVMLASPECLGTKAYWGANDTLYVEYDMLVATFSAACHTNAASS